MLRIPVSLSWSALAVLVAACGTDARMTDPIVLERDFPANVSDPAPSAVAHLSAAAAGVASVAYVSLEPGTVAGAESASILNRRSGAMVIVPMVGGGFDPIAVAANAGDILEITVVSGAATLKTEFPVPIRVRPIVVRTDPPPQKLDVPLNASIVVVFSEPVDPRSLAEASVQLRHGGLAVAGTLGVMPGAPTSVLFVPAAQLDPGTSYDLTVTEGITDLEGDALAAAVQVSFTTVADLGAPLLGKIAFVSNRDGADAIYVTNPDGTVTRLAAGFSPAWSRDGERIAFLRGGNGSDLGIYVMKADGSGLHFVANGSYPSWSPDGSQIAFNGPEGVALGGIFVMNADGTGIHKLIGYEFALPDDGYGAGWLGLSSWSPDGHSIAFVRANYGIVWTMYIMNADGTAPRPLKAGVGDSRPNWSPDGSQLLMQVPNWEIMSVNVNGPGFHSYIGGSYVGGPDWSPDGRSILFEKFTGPGDAISSLGSRMRIFMVGLDDVVERQLIPEAISPALPNYWDHQATWSRVP